MRPEVGYEGKVTYILAGPMGYGTRRYHPGLAGTSYSKMERPRK